jgi:DNA-binding NtrC family response regulator
MEYEDRNFPTLLLFETDPHLREAIAEVLGLFSYKVEVIPNEARLLDRLAEKPTPDLLIAGHWAETPKERSLVRRIRRSMSPIPIVLIGGSSTRIFNPEAIRPDGPLIHLAFPISLDDLIWAVQRTLEKK